MYPADIPPAFSPGPPKDYPKCKEEPKGFIMFAKISFFCLPKNYVLVGALNISEGFWI